jgi:replicative DNA helicase
VREALAEIHAEIMNAEKGLAQQICLKTGNPVLDQYALFQPSYLIYLAGRPSSGKTTFAFHLALKMVAQGIPVYFGSYEVARRFCMVRLLCQAGHIQNKKIMFRNPEEIREQLGVAVNRLHHYPLYLSHRCLSVEGIAQVIEQIREREKKTPVVFLDRFELVDEPFTARDNDYSRLSRIALKLRRLKDEYDTPVCCLIQMNRKIEDRSTKLPLLSDMQGTGATEQCAQVVMFVHRDKVENQAQAKAGIPRKAWIVVEKNMNGRTGKIPYNFEAEIPNFFEMADMEERTEPRTAPPAPTHWQDEREECIF